MKAILDFVGRFGINLSLSQDLMVKKEGRYFLLNRMLRLFIRKDFYYAGEYLGKFKAKKFFPSFILLRKMAEKKAKSIVVDNKASWLFICGRDIFRKGILSSDGSPKANDYVIILNEYNECLGFGKMVGNFGESGKAKDVMVKNISDVGDFLRRENR